MPLYGLDVSEHQNGMYLHRAQAEGYDFVIIRLCDGTYRDKVFGSHLQDAESAGLITSAYWYLRAPQREAPSPNKSTSSTNKWEAGATSAYGSTLSPSAEITNSSSLATMCGPRNVNSNHAATTCPASTRVPGTGKTCPAVNHPWMGSGHSGYPTTDPTATALPPNSTPATPTADGTTHSATTPPTSSNTAPTAMPPATPVLSTSTPTAEATTNSGTCSPATNQPHPLAQPSQS